MAGKMQDYTDDQWDQKTINAYGEGFEYRMKGTQAQQPSTDNPHPIATVEATSWFAGWTAADTATGNPIADGIKMCVAAPFRVALP